MRVYFSRRFIRCLICFRVSVCMTNIITLTSKANSVLCMSVPDQQNKTALNISMDGACSLIAVNLADGWKLDRIPEPECCQDL